MKNSGSGGASRTLSLILTAGGTLLAAFFWLNNLVAAWHYHAKLLRHGRMTALPAGFSAALSWSAIDVSTVTTFIPFFGFALMFFGLLRPRPSSAWPFFPGYDRLNVALGLIGTLWGIILIGFYPAEQVTITALMSCLHTAMFSTLAAILWVMVLEPLFLLPWMHAVRRAASGGADDDDSLDTLVDTLTGGLAAAGSELKNSAAETARFRAELAALDQEFKTMQEQLAALNTRLRDEAEQHRVWQKMTLETLHALVETAENFKAQQQRQSEENARLELECGRLRSELNSAVGEAAELKRRVEAVRGALR